MLFAICNILFVHAQRNNLLGIINYIDQYIEHNNTGRVQWVLQKNFTQFLRKFHASFKRILGKFNENFTRNFQVSVT